ncbi:hypothetical protein HGRIS_000362 [Hohenbuehelia grisea]|uniref:Uncharacterized protein n=1 Tax=Hohenbuehelia grisea TaxID=104357 RepID=A0ABR3JQY7_9AGAR
MIWNPRPLYLPQALNPRHHWVAAGSPGGSLTQRDSETEVASRKRSRATSDSPTPVKRVRSEGHERKPSTGHAMLAISGSLEKVADALLQTPGGPTKTERKTKATKLILAIPAAKLDGPLKIQVVQLFRADVNYADQFLALADDMDFAIEYILAELTDIKAAA